MATDPSSASASDKWEVQMRKGCLEMVILATLWSERLYGLEILDCLERNAGLLLSAGTVYPLLARLKADGLVESEWVDADVVHPRKYYSLTPAGRRRVIEMAQIWVRFADGISGLVSGVVKEEIA